MFWMKRLFMQQFMYVHVLEICLNVQNSVWLKNPEHWKIVTSKKSTNVWFISQSTLSDSSWLLNWLRKSDNSSFDLSGYPLVWVTDYFSYLARVDAGFLASYKPENLAYSIPVITQVWRRQRGRFSDPPFGFELNQSQQIHLNST